MSTSVKCPACGLVNFSTDEQCKRCGAPLAASVQAAEQATAARAQASRKPNLTPCADCEHMISRQAEACPQCGRFIQRVGPPVVVSRAGWPGTIAWGVILAVVVPWLIAVGLFAWLFLIGSVAGRR